MAALLQRVLTGDILPSTLISWLCAGDPAADDTYLLLSDFEKVKVEFVPYFLNFIHEQCSWLIHSTNRSQSPKKLPCNVSDDSAISVDENTKAQRRSKSVIATKDLKAKGDVNYSFSSLESSDSSLKEFGVDTFRTPEKSTSFSSSDRSSTFKINKIQVRHKRNDTYTSAKETQHNGWQKKRISSAGSSFSSDESSRSDESISIPSKTISKFEEKENKLISKAPNINDFDAFPPVGTVISPVKPLPRRIKPTPVQKRTNKDLKLTSTLSSQIMSSVFHTPPHRECNNVFQSTPVKDSKDTSFNEERELLRRTRNHIHNNSLNSRTNINSRNVSNTSLTSVSNLDETTGHFQVPSITNSSERLCNFVMPEFDLISEKNTLNLLINLYSGFIENSLVHNVNIELYFLFQLLTSNTKVSFKNINENREETNCFLSFHNCVYFAVNVLCRQKNLLALLDKPTLKLITKLPYLPAFSNELAETIHSLYSSTPVVNKKRLQPIQGVSFQADTDNRTNFPTGNSFHIFRKQRDLFYELLREWQSHHLNHNCNSNSPFIYKVQHLLRLGSNPANFAHLARLIQSQLITTCCGRAEMDEDEEQATKLKEPYPEKLQERFSAPSRIGDPSPPPAFHGFQGFFKDFLQAAKSAELNQHLIDLLSMKILEINNIDILYESESGIVEENIHEQFLCALHTLQLLGKFLGFLVFFPYQTSELISDELATCQALIRNHILPPLDLILILKEALTAQRLILTVPWIVEYLSMMDPVAPFLIYYQNVNNILFCIYKKDLVNANTFNQNFLRLILGWLFETPSFPKSFFFQENGKSSEDASHFQEHILKNANPLDTLLIIDVNIVSLCCPYLIEIRILLENYFKGIHSSGKEIRKITPISAENSKTLGYTAKQLESQLEENFFHLHPASMKKTVEFVGGRITSKAIGTIRNSMIPNAQTLIINMVKERINEDDSDFCEETDYARALTEEIAAKLYTDVKAKIDKFFMKFCLQEVEKVLPLLLSEDTESKVVEACIKIASRMAINKVSQWVKANVTESYMHTTVKAEVEKVLKKKEIPVIFNLTENNGESGQDMIRKSAMEVIVNLRKYIINVPHSICITDDVLELLEVAKNCLSSNKELTSISVKAICSLTVNLLITLIIYQPKVCCDSLLELFVQFWCESTPQGMPVWNIICPRNIQMMLQSPNEQCSWYVLKELTVKLLECNTLSLQDLHQNVKLVMQQEWPLNILQHFRFCMRELIKSSTVIQNEPLYAEFLKIRD